MNFKPNCTARLPPEPMTGLAAATSGVAQPQPNGLHRWIVQAESVLSAVRIGEVGMVEDVEELGADLRAQPLAEVPVLGNGEIEVPEAGVAETVLRPMFPNCPSGGGIMMELPLA